MTQVKDLELAPSEAMSGLLDVVNEALIEVWLRVPSEMKRFHATQTIAAPTTVSVSPVAGRLWAGSTLSEWVGCAIQYTGDPQPNRLVSANALERPHAGSSGEQSALVWQDGVHISEHATLLNEEVFFEANGQHSRIVPWPHTIPMWAQHDVSPNIPAYYAIRHRGFTAPTLSDVDRPSTAVPPLIDAPHGWFLHLLPRPSVAGILRYSLHITGERLTPRDVSRNVRVLVPDALSEYVVAIAKEKLLATNLFVGSEGVIPFISSEAEKARDALKTLVNSYIEPGGTYGTPLHW